MYTLLKAIVKHKDNPRRWVEKDIGSIVVRDLLNDYREVYAQLKDQFTTNPVIFDFKFIPQEYRNYAGTVTDWLTFIGNRNLPTRVGDLSMSSTYAHYADAFYAGYKIDRVSRFGAIANEEPKEDKDWLLVRHRDPQFNHTLFSTNCLTFINGFLHYNEASETGVYIKEGYKSTQVCSHATLGIISFKDIGAIEQIPITIDRIYPQGSRALKDRVVIDLGQNISNKTIMLSIGGYLITPDSGLFSYESSERIIVRMHEYPLIDRFFESRDYLDTSAYKLEKPSSNIEQVSVEELKTDLFIKTLMTGPQSFIIIIDNPNVYFDREHVRTNQLPGSFTAYTKPVYPLIAGSGVLANYWPQYQNPYWALQTLEHTHQRRQYNSTKLPTTMDGARRPFDPVNFSKGFFLKIGVDALIA